MPRGVYKRKKYLAFRRQMEPTEEERTDTKKQMLVQQLISSIQNQLNLLREITNG
jgi:hypothetical protein